MEFLTINDLDCEGKRVLVRTDLNVPTKKGKITDATRIEKSLPTLQALVKRNARVIVMSHSGRPEGKPDPEFSLKPVAEYIGKLLPGVRVLFAEDCVGSVAEQKVAELKPGEVLILENVRFHKEEEKDDEKFAQALARLGDFYVNDAFATSHRAHASVSAITRLLPSAAGYLMEQELWSLGRALQDPQRPLVAIASGAKVSTKLDVLRNLATKVDVLVLSGGMASTVLYAQGKEVGTSLCEKDMKESVMKLVAAAKANKCELLLPVDVVVAKEFKAKSPSQVVDIGKIPKDSMMLDIGPKTVDQIKKRLQSAKTVIWNGPLGVFEMEGFENGTRAVAEEISRLTAGRKLLSVAGGGDTVAALAKLVPDGQFSFVSTAGGAFLEFMEGRVLPGVAALSSVHAQTERMAMLKAKDVMTSPVFSVEKGDKVGKARQLMHERRTRHVPVVDSPAEQQLVGLLSHRDVLRLLAEQKDLDDKTVGEVMTASVTSVGEDMPLSAAARIIVDHKYGCLPVVSKGNRLVGIITEHDFVKVVSKLLTHAEDVQRTVFSALARRQTSKP